MHRWNKEYLQKIERKDKAFKEFSCFCFNKANEIAGEINLQWIKLQFYEQGFRELKLQQAYESWSFFSKKYKQYEETKIKFQYDFLEGRNYIHQFKDLLIAELDSDSDYESEYEKEKEQIMDFCFNSVMTDLECMYESYFGEKSHICIERLKKYK